MKLDDVAKLANVSIATVSRVLNNAAPVRSATKARVLKAIRELKYRPNIHASLLAGAKSTTLGMIVSNLENPFFLDIFRSLEAEAHQHGYKIIVSNTDYDPRKLVEAVNVTMARRPAGLAVIVSEMDPAVLQDLSESNLPVVVYAVGSPSRNISSIRMRYGKGIQKVVEYLHSMGHRRMAFVAHHAELGPVQQRRKSFLEALEKYGGEVERATVNGPDAPNGGRQATRELLASGFKPTAIVCVNDFMAIGVIKELREQRLAVPGDVSVTGYDNISLSEYVSPQLTTVNIPREKIGRLAFSSLVPGANGDSDGEGREYLVDPELIVRESTGPAPRS